MIDADRCTELQNWLVNAFNGEWLKVANAVPIDNKKRRLVAGT